MRPRQGDYSVAMLQYSTLEQGAGSEIVKAIVQLSGAVDIPQGEVRALPGKQLAAVGQSQGACAVPGGAA